MKIFSCTNCNKTFTGYKHKETKRVFCSQKCYWFNRKSWIPNRKGAKMTYKQRLNISLGHRGEKHWNWKGGAYTKSKTLRYKAMNTIRYKQCRKSVFERDEYTCVECGAKNGEGKAVVLQADHIQQWSLFPKLRYILGNGRTLCFPCHKNTLTWGNNSQK